MGAEKCRLCLCSVDSLTGLSSSFADEGFHSMIKSVFLFPVSEPNPSARTNYSLPILVCFQCSSTVRNFYYFSQNVKMNQKQLEREREANRRMQTPTSDDCTIHELIQRIKKEPEFGSEEHGENLNDNIMISSDLESLGSRRRPITNQVVRTSEPPSECEDVPDKDTDMQDLTRCTIRSEVVGKLDTMDKRISSVTAKLSMLTNKIVHTRETQVASSSSYVSFDFSPIATEQEITTFDKDLSDNEYFKKVQDWLNSHVTAVYYENRLLEAQDLLFHKEFLLGCSWTGTGKYSSKIALKQLRNVLNLFKAIGNTRHTTVNDTLLAKYFMKKLKHAKQRIRSRGLRKSVCRIRRT